MTDSLRHRGPDGSGFHLDPGVGLGHRRLAIIDVAGGQQPLYNEDSSVALVYNGEIYNFRELTRELESHGHRFRTHSDTEVVVHAWEQWGAACVERFRGMFAFALWDQTKQRLFLARDRLGIKPLYYTLLPDRTLIFASELKALLVHPGLSRQIDETALDDYFAYGYVPDPKTIYRDVHKLPPAHVLTAGRDEPLGSPSAYWDVQFDPRPDLNEETACGELIELLQESVKLRLISEVPLGAFLSGGVDSSAVVAAMTKAEASQVNTCSIGFDEPAFDESHYADSVAAGLGTNHHAQTVSSDSDDVIRVLADTYDEPFADSSAIPTYRLSALARQRVTVALSGDGGDEVFAGYRRYKWHAIEESVRAVVPGPLRRCVFGTLGAVYPKLDWAPRPLRAKSTLQSLAVSEPEGYFNSVSLLPDVIRLRLYSPALRRRLQDYHPGDLVRRVIADAPGDHALDRIQYADLKTYLPGDILTKVDRASMAHSLEVRVPLLDHHLVEWAARLPTHMRLNNGQGKVILKKAMEPQLDHDVLYRAKMGFSVPLARWIRGPLYHEIRDAFTDGVMAQSGLLDSEFVLRLLEQHKSGTRDFSAPLWALYRFAAFWLTVHTGQREPKAA